VPDRVLLIDDDPRLAQMLQQWLGGRGITLEHRATGAGGLSAVGPRGDGLDLVLLDLGLPDMDGLDLCRQLRARAPALPLIMLTARGDPEDRVLGLELGADDYLPKPFDPRELLARIRALLRRSRPAAPGGALRFGALVLDPDAREVRKDGVRLPLTAHQLSILWALASRAGRVLSRAQIGEAVDGGRGDIEDRTIDVQISRIRALIEDDPRQPRLLQTVRGLGYVFARGPADGGGGAGG
jgi:two-component system, OmpR family, phosphate regulon response regulator OmpR